MLIDVKKQQLLVFLTIISMINTTYEGLKAMKVFNCQHFIFFVMFIVIFFTFPFGILGQEWYLIVSNPDPCCLSYFYMRN